MFDFTDQTFLNCVAQLPYREPAFNSTPNPKS